MKNLILILVFGLGCAAQITQVPAASGGGGGAPSGAAGGDLGGTYPNPSVAKLNGVAAASYALLSGAAFTGGVSSTGSFTSGVGSGVAGATVLLQGTAPSFAANSFSFYAPASIPVAYQWKVPSADGAGLIASNGSGVLSIVALQGSDSNILTAGSISGTGVVLFTDSSAGAASDAAFVWDATHHTLLIGSTAAWSSTRNLVISPAANTDNFVTMKSSTGFSNIVEFLSGTQQWYFGTNASTTTDDFTIKDRTLNKDIVYLAHGGGIGLGPGNTAPNTTVSVLNSSADTVLRIGKATTNTSATSTTVDIYAGQSQGSAHLFDIKNNAGTAQTYIDAAYDLTIIGQKSTTGTRYACFDTAGKVVSSASACSGT